MTSTPRIATLLAEVVELAGALHLLADAAARRSDADARGALCLLARHSDDIAEHVEELAHEESRS